MPRTLLSLLVFAALAAPAAAQSTNHWGAIAFGSPDRVAGTAIYFYSAGEARQAALDGCGGRCTRTIAFMRACAAVAESPSGAVGWSSSRWRGRVIARALAQCGRSDCAVVAVACTH